FRSALLAAWFSSEIAASISLPDAEITFTVILSFAAPCFSLFQIAAHTFSAASLLQGAASRMARTNSQSLKLKVFGSFSATAWQAISPGVGAFLIETAKLAGGS